MLPCSTNSRKRKSNGKTKIKTGKLDENDVRDALVGVSFFPISENH
jgi:hypothetical protein